VAEQSRPFLQVSDLTVTTLSGAPLVRDMSLHAHRGEIVGLVGESGSGKTTTALALLGYARHNTIIARGHIRIGDHNINVADDRMSRRLRGKVVSYIPQDAGASLNPSIRVGRAVDEMASVHLRDSGRAMAAQLFESVGLPSTEPFLRRFPHQLSGGQQHRVTIAMALVCDPPLIVLDEPTTGLDVITQDRIIQQLMAIRDERGATMIYITHDLAVVAEIADRIAVIYAGRIVEIGPTASLLRDPRHPYTRGLLQSIPDHRRPRQLRAMPGIAPSAGQSEQGCAFASRCPIKVEICEHEAPALLYIGQDREARCHRSHEPASTSEVVEMHPVASRSGSKVALSVRDLRAEHRVRGGRIVAAEGISFELPRGGCVALVGESGSGKTTIARTIAGVHPIAAGGIWLDGQKLASDSYRRSAEQRKNVQMVLQNPADSLNPRQTVGIAIARPARLLRGLSRAESRAEAVKQLAHVRLPSTTVHRYPSELSGGERQRVSIARALAADPTVIICDEITSALDVSVQAAVLELLTSLRAEFGVSLLFVTHDLGVVASVADQVLVLKAARICEAGPVLQVLGKPQDEYTKRLLEAAPSVSSAVYQGTQAAECQPDL